MWTSLQRWLPPASNRRDILRLTLQAGLAAGLAMLVMDVLDASEPFLAVVSAVLVLQRDSDQTLGTAAVRMVAAAVGTVVGGLSLALLGPVLPDTVPVLVAALVMGGIVAWKPSMNFGVIAGVGLAMGADGGLLQAVQERSLAIFLGVLIGIGVGLVVLPDSARSRARRQLQEVLQLCAALLNRTMETALDAEHGELSVLHARFGEAMNKLRDTVAAPRLQRREQGAAYGRAVQACERFWHALLILDRVAETGEGSLQVEQVVRDRLTNIRAAAAEALACLSRLRQVADADLAALTTSCRHAHRDAGHGWGTDNEVRSIALIFGLSEVSRNIAEINEAVCAIRAAD